MVEVSTVGVLLLITFVFVVGFILSRGSTPKQPPFTDEPELKWKGQLSTSSVLAGGPVSLWSLQDPARYADGSQLSAESLESLMRDAERMEREASIPRPSSLHYIPTLTEPRLRDNLFTSLGGGGWSDYAQQEIAFRQNAVESLMRPPDRTDWNALLGIDPPAYRESTDYVRYPEDIFGEK